MPVSLSALAPLRVVDQRLLDGTGAFTSEATTLFVDLVGFTPLTDELGRFGSRGTEQLSEVLQRFFGSVTEEAAARGGDPVAYGGDALTIVFDGDGPTVAAARELADTIQQLSADITGTETLAGRLSLQTRIGIARGAVTTSVVHANDRSLPLQLGVGLDRAVAAESEAAVGQVVCHESAVSAGTRAAVASPGKAARGPSTRGGAVDSESLARLVHPAVLGHLLADSSLWQSHRTVTAAFISFPPVDPDDLSDFVRTAAQLMHHVDDCGGEVVQLSGGDKGVVALVVFGAPVGHDDDPLRAIQAMLEFRRLVPAVKAGLTTGPVFTTWLGSERRRFQAHFGGALNMAARLMQAGAAREVLVDTATWRAAGVYLRQRGGPRQIRVKGHPEPLEVRDVAGWRRRRRRPTSAANTVLAGRESESALIEDLLDDVQAKRGQARTFIGDPGIGKSRLAEEAADRARARGMQVLEVDADDYPYGQMAGLWREVLGQRLGIAPSSKRAAWHEALQSRLPGQAVRIDVLGPVLGISRGSRDMASELEPGLAVELAQALVSRVVIEGPSDDPTLIIIENAHHLPPVSRSLLTHLQHRVVGTAVGLLVTERTRTATGADVDRVGRTRKLVELSEVASTTLIEDTWRQAGGGSPPPWLATMVYQQAGGNPLFLRAATSRMRSRWRPGDPPPQDDREGDGDSLANVLTERIDLLDAGQRQVLAVLAVARRPCRLTTSVELLTGHVDAASVRVAVRLLQDGNFIRLLPIPDVERYRIRHDLLRRVVYEQMSHADRVRIHRAMSELLIRQDASPGEIADHVRHLDDSALGRTWYPLAAVEARRSWSVVSAIEWWRMALPLLEGRERAEGEVELLELFLVGGRAADVLAAMPASSDHREASDQALTADELSVRRMLAVAEAAFSCGDFARCEAECSTVMGIAEDRDEGRYQRAAELLVRSMCDRGSMTEAVSLARIQLARAAKNADPRYLTTANASLGAALLLSGDPSAAARHYEAALEGAASTGDAIHQIHVLSDLAGCAYAVDDYPRCLDLLEQARALAESIGYRQHLMFSLINEAQLRAGLGDPHAASRAYIATQRALELGDLASAAETFHTWLTSDVKLMTSVDAWQRLAHANERLGRTLHVADCYANLAVASARLGDARAVETASQKVRSHQEVTPGSTLDRRVELATTLLAASKLPEGPGNDPLNLAHDLEALCTLPDVGDLERAELRVVAWHLAPDEAHHAHAVEAVHVAFGAEPSGVVRAWFDELGVQPPPDRHRLPPPIGITGENVGPKEFDTALSALEAALDARSDR